ncbi:MAG: VCBS repeat-containing protein, partial [Planctomycetaceae bacterium]|nr:VCBS repeat-containing protein [Planctomycetaceae bacterium]
VGDFDQDGRTDVIAVDTGDNTTAIRWFTPKEDPTSTFRRTTIDRLEWADSETTSVDIDNDGQLELLVTSRFNYRTGDDRVWIYERTSDFGFTRVQVGSDYIGPVIGTGDLDNDGDLDLVGKNFIFWNTGGDFHIETTDVSPISIASGRTSPVLRIDATHNGQFGDEDILLANFSFMVDDGSGQVGANPLDSSTFASLFDSWRIYLDDGDGIFMGDEDLLVSVTPATQSGVVQVDLATAAATLRRLHPEETRSFFLEVDMGATAHEYGDFRITNLTDLGILAGKDAGAVDPSGITNVIKDYSPNVSASLVSASNIAFTLNTVTLNEGIIPPSTTIEVLRIDATQAGLVEGEIASLAFRFDEDGRPLDHTEVNGLIESLIIEGEDRNTIVRVDDLNVNNSGLLRIELPDGDSRVRFLNESKSFFVVVQTGADSINQGGRKFRITHLTDASNVEDERSFVEVASNDGPATLVGTPDQSATIFAGTEINIAVTSSLSTPVTGQQVTYTVTVANQHDTTDASAIPLAGRIPANLLNVVLTNLQVTGGATSTKSIGESVSGNWTDTLDLPHQGSVTYTFTGTIAELGATDRSMESEFLISQVSVDLPVEFYDLNSADNQSLRSDLIRLSSTGTGEFVDSGIDFADLDGLGAERVNKIALGDIDGDGDVDAIVTRGAAGAPGYATVLLNDGAGNYTESNQDLGYSNFTGAVLADFDRDGDLDLYLATSTGISGVTDDTDRVYLNDGSGVFTKTVQSFSYLTEAVQVGDTDRDGDLDIVISGADFSYTLRNFGGGIFVPSSRLGVLDNLSQMKFADMDSDGDLDIVGLGTDLRLFLNDGRGFYQAGIRVTRFATDFELGDLDNDGNIDILVAEGSYYDPNSDFLGDERLLSSLVSFSNDGTGNFAQSIVSLPSSYQQIELGDFDNDGDLDAFVVDEIYDGTYDIQLYRGIYYGTVYGVDLAVPETVVGKFLSNDGTGMFADSGQTLDYQVELSDELTYSPNELYLTAADINGDGSLDVVT